MKTSPARTDVGEVRDHRIKLLKYFLALLLISFLLRIFYWGNLYEDDGLWFTAAEEMLRGKSLYVEIYFDKPPLLPLLYAALFKLAGAHIIVIRLFSIFYSVAVSALLYLFGKRLYNERVGMIAAAAFVIFSTTYTTGHMQGLNTDFLMALPYIAAAYFFVRSRLDHPSRRWLALAGGAIVALAIQANPKAAFDLIFFALFLIAARKWNFASADEKNVKPDDLASAPSISPTSQPPLTVGLLTPPCAPAPLPPRSPAPPPPCAPAPLVLFTLAGFVAGTIPFLVYLAAMRSLSHYWLNVWVWGSRYAGYFPAKTALWTALGQSAGYFALNNTLMIALAVLTIVAIRRSKQRREQVGNDGAASTDPAYASDITLLIWFAVSYAGLATGGRFYGHYFFQIIPALSLILARATMIVIPMLRASAEQKISARIFRRAAIAILLIGFLFTLVRFHARIAALASDRISGEKSRMTVEWFQERLTREERMAAAFVRDMPEGASDLLSLEALREDGPRRREATGSQDYLFVWGYRPEIYYWSGLLPASRFLSTQPLTGVPADVHYFHYERGRLFSEEETARARALLLDDLKRMRPKYIIDELAVFNSSLSMKSFPELAEFLKDYKRIAKVGRFRIYRGKEFSRKKRNSRSVS